MFPIAGVPVARVIVDRVRKSLGVGTQFVICCLERDEKLFAHEFRDVPNARISTSSKPLGPAWQLMYALGDQKIQSLTMPTGEDDYPNVMVHYGDCLVGADYHELWREHRGSEHIATLLATNNVRSPYGQITLENPKNTSSKVTGFHEKPPLAGHTWTGIAMVNLGELKAFAHPESDFGHDIFPAMLKANKNVGAYVTDAAYYDVGDVQAYMRVNDLAMREELFA